MKRTSVTRGADSVVLQYAWKIVGIESYIYLCTGAKCRSATLKMILTDGTQKYVRVMNGRRAVPSLSAGVAELPW